MQLNLSQIENAFELREGLPRPNWPLIYDNIPQDLNSDQLHSIYNSIVVQWLQALIRHLPPGYAIDESRNFFILSCEPIELRTRIIAETERVRADILAILGDVGSDDGYGKHVILGFRHPNEFIDYIADFFPAGEYGSIIGVMLSQHYIHMAIHTKPEHEYLTTIVHELTHCLLAHLPLPLWLNEGITAMIERHIIRTYGQSPSYGLVNSQRKHWTESNIAMLHTGEAFSSTVPTQPLAYALSHSLVHNLFADFPHKMNDFIRTAHYNDSGDSALQATCGVTLSDRIAQTLGPGNWSPVTPLFPAPSA